MTIHLLLQNYSLQALNRWIYILLQKVVNFLTMDGDEDGKPRSNKI